MILWTIQEEAIYEKLLKEGVYHCDFSRSLWVDDWKYQYDWLVSQMTQRIGPPPEGVSYPVWAWHTQNGKRKKPDLRSARWGNGRKGDRYVCMEIDVPDEQVLLSDFDAWFFVISHHLISSSKKEDDEMEKRYKSLNSVEQKKMMEKNWERVFDITPFKNAWMIRGEWIQATFWELKKEWIRDVRYFTSAVPKEWFGEETNEDA